MNDVKTIHSIPKIDSFINETFKLILFDVGDSTAIYEHKITDDVKIVIEFIIDSGLIDTEMSLNRILVVFDIKYFAWQEVIDDDDVINAYYYRPLIDSSEKEFIK